MSDEPQPQEVPIDLCRVDWFMADTLKLEIEITDDAKKLLLAHAKAYLSVAEKFPYDRWASLSDSSKALFIQAEAELRGKGD